MTNPKVSSHQGMGAIPYSQGTAFRVWAPFADKVYVAGTFNNWSEVKNPLVSENNGYWSTDVKNVKKGAEYKYLLVCGDKKIWRIDPYAKDVTSSVGHSVVYSSKFNWGDKVFIMPPLNELVIYEMHIGTFNDKPGGTPGTLDSAIKKLPYLKALGINAIEVMPAMEFAGAFSWGYNPSHIFSLESDYGAPDKFKKFIKAVHDQGIAVIFDVVYNHFGPSDLDIWQFDGWNEDNQGGIYFYNDWRAETPWGDTRPDYGREAVRRYIRDNVLFWLEEYQIDGLRWDATAYIRNVYGYNNDPASDLFDGWTLMQWINSEIKMREPWKISIAEDLRNNDALTKEINWGGAGFDTQWDSEFVYPIREAIITREDSDRDMYKVKEAIDKKYNGDFLQRVIYTESHDEVANGKCRVPEEIWPDHADSYYSKKRSVLGAALTFTSPGIPMIFQGQEFLEDDWFHDTDPIDWKKKDTFSGIVKLYTDLIKLRRNWYNHTRGLRGEHVNVHHVNNNDKVIAFHRWENGGPGDDVMVIVNMSNKAYYNYTLGFPSAGKWSVRFNSDWQGYDKAFGNFPAYDIDAYTGGMDGMWCHGTVSLGAYTVIIMSQ